MQTGKELEAHEVEKGRLSCDSDAPQVGSHGPTRQGSLKWIVVKGTVAKRDPPVYSQ